MFAWIVGLSCAYLWACVVRIFGAMRAVPPLGHPPAPSRWPSVSLIVPARDEIGSIERATQSRLSVDYPDFELVLVDDRSTDGTTERIRDLAATNPRVRAVHITELPEGWLGKLHALHKGVENARGEWLLFSDADISFEPNTIARAIAYAEAGSFDHVVMLGHIHGATLLTDAVINTLLLQLCIGIDVKRIQDPESRAAVGGGMFSLVKRSAFEKTRGFEWLRLEVLDDVALGQMLKDAGARQSFVRGCDAIHLTWYATLGEMMRGLEKNVVAIFKFHFSWLLLGVVVFLTVALAPWIGLILGGAPWVRPLAGITIALAVYAQFAFVKFSSRRWQPILVGPLGVVLLLGMVLRAGILMAVRGGIMWRGTLHETKALRRGSRVRILS